MTAIVPTISLLLPFIALAAGLVFSIFLVGLMGELKASSSIISSVVMTFLAIFYSFTSLFINSNYRVKLKISFEQQSKFMGIVTKP
jgi:LytS/YehU family sensor histidine kinase